MCVFLQRRLFALAVALVVTVLVPLSLTMTPTYLAHANADPTHQKHLRLPRSQLRAERIYWDQACVLKQLGLLPKGLPIAGVEQALKAEDAGSVPSNLMLEKQQQAAQR